MTKKIKVLVIQPIHQAGIDLLKKNPNYEFEIFEDTNSKELQSKISQCDAISIRTAKLSEDFINKTENLKIISRHGVGYDNIDLKSSKKKNITLTITATANAVAVAEHVWQVLADGTPEVGVFGHGFTYSGHPVGAAVGLENIKIMEEETIPLLIHGDASFPGQGIVAEMFNMAHLDGYTVGGTIHFVVNNQIGFTTNPHDSYSGRYCTDIAKMVGAPILHVNGYDPEACVHAVKLAVAYRQTFHNDIVIDLWGYRQHGHNESDEPTYTQPQMYEKIRQMRPVTESYAEQLIKSGSLSQDAVDLMSEEVRSALDASQIRTKENPVRPHIPPYQKSSPWEGLKGDPTQREVDTTVTLDELSRVAAAMNNTPDGFNIHRKLKKLVATRTNVIEENGKLHQI